MLQCAHLFIMSRHSRNGFSKYHRGNYTRLDAEYTLAFNTLFGTSKSTIELRAETRRLDKKPGSYHQQLCDLAIVEPWWPSSPVEGEPGWREAQRAQRLRNASRNLAAKKARFQALAADLEASGRLDALAGPGSAANPAQVEDDN
jgi:hypothetical protein